MDVAPRTGDVGRVDLPVATHDDLAGLRDAVRAAFAGRSDLDDVVLVASELAAESLRGRAGTGCRVVVAGGDRVRVEVIGPAPPEDATSPTCGLFVVSRLATEWGLRDDGGATVAWAELG